MKQIVVHTAEEVILNEPLPDGVGVFFHNKTAKVFETEAQANKYAELVHGNKPTNVNDLKAFATEMNIPFDKEIKASELQELVDNFISTSNYPVTWEAGL
jgi:hypothetical protein